ncbi:MAG: hypothetical protein AAF514_00095 [Verrucomicrobiota bacterium]
MVRLTFAAVYLLALMVSCERRVLSDAEVAQNTLNAWLEARSEEKGLNVDRWKEGQFVYTIEFDFREEVIWENGEGYQYWKVMLPYEGWIIRAHRMVDGRYGFPVWLERPGPTSGSGPLGGRHCIAWVRGDEIVLTK